MSSKPATPRRQYPQLQWQVPELPAILLDPARDVEVPGAQKKSAGLGWNTPPLPGKPTQSGVKGKLEQKRPQTSAGVPPATKASAERARRTGDFGPSPPKQSSPKRLVSAVKRSISRSTAASSKDMDPGSKAQEKPEGSPGGASKLDWGLPKAAVKTGQKLVGKLIPSGRSSRASADNAGAPARAPAAAKSAAEADSESSAGDSKWSRLQALKAMRSAQARAAMPERPPSSPAPPAQPPAKAPAPGSSPAASRPAKSVPAQPAAVPAAAAAPPRKPVFGLRKPKVSADQPSSQARRPPPLEQPQQTAEARAQLDMYAAAAAAAPREKQDNLVTCQGCDRSFVPEAYERHARICAKVFQTKRKAFNAAAARAPDEVSDGTFGTPAPPPARGARSSGSGGPAGKAGAKAGGAKAGAAGAKAAAAGGKAAKWKAQSAQLRAAMAAARGAADGDPTVFAAPVVDDSLTPCPHCGRRFNDKAAERHIPLCKDIRAKPTSLRAGGGRGAGAFARR